MEEDGVGGASLRTGTALGFFLRGAGVGGLSWLLLVFSSPLSEVTRVMFLDLAVGGFLIATGLREMGAELSG